MRILVDTNVLVRLAETGHASHATARAAVKTLSTDEHVLAIVPQVIYEFWAVATRGVAANGLGHEPPVAARLVEEFEALFVTLRDERAIYGRWRDLVTEKAVRGYKSHDARLVAAMGRHAIGHILTFNDRDFRRFDGVEILEPALVAENV